MSYPLGVDIGTTYTAAALWRDGRVQTVPLGNRANAVPSVLFLRDDGTMLVGEAAARRGMTDPDSQAREFKRRMGDDVPVLVGGRGFMPQQLTGEVLRWVVDRVSEVQGGPPRHVVLTHPAAWGEFRKGLLAQAAAATGLPDVGLLAEPVAAATWYAAQERVEPGSLIGIYDFGGGTFDASVVRKTATGVEIHGEAGGDDSIGGIDFDHALFRHVGASAGMDISQFDMTDPVVAGALAQLFTSVVEAKEALSADVEVVIPVQLPGVSRQVLITRTEFEGLIRDRVLGTVGVFGQVVRRSGVDPAKLHGVLLVGGSSRIPLVRQLLSAELGIRVAVDAHPKYTVSLGAAIAAAPRVAPPRMPQAAPGPVRPMPPPPRTQPRPIVRQPGQRSVPSFAAPAVSEQIDLARTGLTGATDVRTVLASLQPSGPVMVAPPRRNDQFTEIRTKAPAKKGRLIALLVVMLIVVAVIVTAVFLLRPSRSDSGQTSTGGVTAPAVKTAGTVTVQGEAVIPPDGADAMRAVGNLNGSIIAVGVSRDLNPRAWAGDHFAPVTVPFDGKGAMLDVAVNGSTAVAVGSTGVGAAARPAVWTSGDGKKWDLVPPQGDLAPNSGVKELTSVTTGPGGKLFATAADHRVDKVDGDVAVYRSVDGKAWEKVPATGLDGTGPQSVQRMITVDGRLIAVGSALSGAKLGPAIWTSTDGITWQSSPYVPEGAPTLQGVAKRGDGSLIACGSAEADTVACWIQKDGQRWDRWAVVPANGAPAPQFLYGLFVSDQGVVLAGIGRSGSTSDAAIWRAEFSQ